MTIFFETTFLANSADPDQMYQYDLGQQYLLMHFDDILSYDIAVIEWITACHKNSMTTRVITHWCKHVMSLTTSLSTTRFLIEIALFLRQ